MTIATRLSLSDRHHESSHRVENYGIRGPSSYGTLQLSPDFRVPLANGHRHVRPVPLQQRDLYLATFAAALGIGPNDDLEPSLDLRAALPGPARLNFMAVQTIARGTTTQGSATWAG